MGFATASLIFGGGGTTVLTASQLFIGRAVFAIASTVVTSALTPKPKMPTIGGSNLGVGIDPIGASEIVYGQVRKGGVKTYHETTGDGKYYHYFLTLAMHEVEEIGQIYVNDAAVTVDGNGFVTSNDWNSKILVKKFTGTSSQNIYSSLSSLSNGPSNYTSTFKGQGVACLYVRLEYDRDVFQSGMPLVTAVVKGKKLYDPRKDSTSDAYDSSLGVSTHRSSTASTWQYSSNPALAMRDYLTSSQGVAADHSQIDDVMIGTAADDCASLGSYTENSFEIGGSITTGDTKLNNLNSLIKCFNGTLFWAQGKFRLVAGAYHAPTITDAFTLDDVRGPISIQTRFSRRDLVNTVRGTFIDKDERWIATEFPQVQLADMTEDNDVESVIDLELPLVTKSAAAQRLAKQVLYTSREQITLSARFSARAYQVQVGDTIKLTMSRYGWTNKVFLVKGWKATGGDGSPIEVELTLQETSSTAYQWSVSADEYAAITSNNTNLDDIAAGLAVGTPTVSQSTAIQSDGTVVAKAAISWTAATSGQVIGYDVEWKASGDTIYSKTFTDTSNILLTNLASGQSYTVNVYAVTSRGNRTADSSKGSVTFTASGDTTAPTTPNAPTVTASDNGTMFISWNDVTDNDLSHYEVYRGTSYTAVNTLIGTSVGSEFTDIDVSPRTNYYYRVKSVDHTGNASSTSGYGTDQSVAGSPEYAELQVGDPYVVTVSAGTSVYLSSMSGGAGDFWFIRNNGSGALTPTINASLGTVTFDKDIISQGNQVGGGTYIVDYIMLMTPTEETNTDQEVDAVATLKVGSLLGYAADAAYSDLGDNEGITWRITEIFDKITVNTYSFYLFGVTRISGSGTVISNIETANFFINQQLRGSDGSDGATGARGAGRWHINVSALPETATEANTAFTDTDNDGVGVPVAKDQAWFYTGTEQNPTGQVVWIYDGSTWNEQIEVIDGNLLVSGTITAGKLDTNSVTADNIVAGEITADKLDINDELVLGDGAGFLAGRDFNSDYGADGFFVGRETRADGTQGFEVSTSSTNPSGQITGIIHNETDDLQIFNPKFLIGGSASGGSTLYASDHPASSPVNLGINEGKTITVTALGGGGGGGGGWNDRGDFSGGYGGDGGDTVVELYHTSVTASNLITTVTGSGGAGGQSGAGGRASTGGVGGSTSYGAGGAGGPLRGAGTDATTNFYGTGGGGGGGDDSGINDRSGAAGLGGAAGSQTVANVQISQSTNIYAVITIGGGGLGNTSTDYNGGDGEHGIVAITSVLGGTRSVSGGMLPYIASGAAMLPDYATHKNFQSSSVSLVPTNQEHGDLYLFKGIYSSTNVGDPYIVHPAYTRALIHIEYYITDTNNAAQKDVTAGSSTRSYRWTTSFPTRNDIGYIYLPPGGYVYSDRDLYIGSIDTSTNAAKRKKFTNIPIDDAIQLINAFIADRDDIAQIT